MEAAEKRNGFVRKRRMWRRRGSEPRELESKINYKCNRLETILFLLCFFSCSFTFLFQSRMTSFFLSSSRTLVDERRGWLGFVTAIMWRVFEVVDKALSEFQLDELFWGFLERRKAKKESEVTQLSSRVRVCMRTATGGGTSQMQNHQKWIFLEYQNRICSKVELKIWESFGCVFWHGSSNGIPN